MHTSSVKNLWIVSLCQANSSPNPVGTSLSCREISYFFIFSSATWKTIFMCIFPICLVSLLHSKSKQKVSNLLQSVSQIKILLDLDEKFILWRSGPITGLTFFKSFNITWKSSVTISSLIDLIKFLATSSSAELQTLLKLTKEVYLWHSHSILLLWFKEKWSCIIRTVFIFFKKGVVLLLFLFFLLFCVIKSSPIDPPCSGS